MGGIWAYPHRRVLMARQPHRRAAVARRHSPALDRVGLLGRAGYFEIAVQGQMGKTASRCDCQCAGSPAVSARRSAAEVVRSAGQVRVLYPAAEERVVIPDAEWTSRQAQSGAQQRRQARRKGLTQWRRRHANVAAKCVDRRQRAAAAARRRFRSMMVRVTDQAGLPRQHQDEALKARSR